MGVPILSLVYGCPYSPGSTAIARSETAQILQIYTGLWVSLFSPTYSLLFSPILSYSILLPPLFSPILFPQSENNHIRLPVSQFCKFCKLKSHCILRCLPGPGQRSAYFDSEITKFEKNATTTGCQERNDCGYHAGCFFGYQTRGDWIGGARNNHRAGRCE
jgi:hypothetical protein